MVLTTEWISDAFERCNRMYFRAVLPVPNFSISTARTYLGLCKYRYNETTGQNECFEIVLSSFRTLSEEQYIDVLLHEMIHYFIAYFSIKDSSTHGCVFKAMMRRLNMCGRHIAISHRANEVWTKSKAEQYLIVALVDEKLGWLMGRIADTRVRDTARRLQEAEGVLYAEWFVSDHPDFAHFSKARSLRFRRVRRTYFEEQIARAQPCEELAQYKKGNYPL